MKGDEAVQGAFFITCINYWGVTEFFLPPYKMGSPWEKSDETKLD